MIKPIKLDQPAQRLVSFPVFFFKKKIVWFFYIDKDLYVYIAQNLIQVQTHNCKNASQMCHLLIVAFFLSFFHKAKLQLWVTKLARRDYIGDLDICTLWVLSKETYFGSILPYPLSPFCQHSLAFSLPFKLTIF